MESSERKIGGAVGAGILLVLLTALVSGVSNFVNFWAVQGTNSDAFIAVRNAAVALMLVPLVLLAGGEARRRLTKAQWGRLAVIGLIGGAIPFVLFFRGLQLAGQSGAATATFGYRTLFLMASLLAVVSLHERVSRRVALGATVLLAGIAVPLALTGPIWTDGTAYVLIATALWAGEYTLSKSTLRDLPSGTVALGRMGFGGAFLLGYLALTNQFAAVGAFGAQQWMWMALSALLLVGFVTTWYAGLKSVDLSVASSALVLALPITWALGLVFGRTALDPAAAASAVAITLGAALVLGLTSLKETWVWLARAVRSKLRSGA